MTPSEITTPCTAFIGDRLLNSGPLIEVALSVKSALAGKPEASVLVFSDRTGKVVDLDLRGSKEDIILRLSSSAPQKPSSSAADDSPRGRGRPKLGVTAREVTLLPRHWEWLGSQPGGASAVLRRLVEEARRSSANPARRRKAAQEAAYHFMHAMAGDFPGFEEASRALFADDREKLAAAVAEWPEDVRNHLLRLSEGTASHE